VTLSSNRIKKVSNFEEVIGSVNGNKKPLLQVQGDYTRHSQHAASVHSTKSLKRNLSNEQMLNKRKHQSGNYQMVHNLVYNDKSNAPENPLSITSLQRATEQKLGKDIFANGSQAYMAARASSPSNAHVQQKDEYVDVLESNSL
jgi:hypothetical protein